LFTGIILLFLGIYLIWNNLMHSLYRYIPDVVYNAIYDVTRVAPQIIIGIAIIVVGVNLILGKKRECDTND